MRPNSILAILLSTGAWGLGCREGVPPPQNEWAAAQADVGRAQAGGASDVPEAKLHLDLAMEDLQRSKQAMGEDNRRAASLSDLARVEARLAFSLAKAAAAQDVARKTQGDLQRAKNP